MFSGSNKLKKNPKALKSSKKELGTSLKEVEWPVLREARFLGGYLKEEIMECKGNSKCKINVLVSKKNSTTTLKKTSIINNISLQNTSCKNMSTNQKG